VEDFPMGAGKWQRVQIIPWQPLTCRTIGYRALIEAESISLQRDAITGDSMLDDARRLEARRADAQHTPHRLLQGGTCSQLDIREFPKVRIDSRSWSLPHQKMTAMLDNEGRESAWRRRCSPTQIRQTIRPGRAVSHTLSAERALNAIRLTGNAYERAEFHQRLI